MTVKQIIEKYMNECEWGTEYYTNNPDNGTADFVESHGYGEAIDTVIEALQNVDSEESHDIAKLLEKCGIENDEALTLIHKHCTVRFSEGVFYQSNEVYGMTLGEVEIQPEDELHDAFKALTEDEKKTVQREVDDGYISDDGWLYLNMSYDRWVSILDVDSLLDELQQIASEQEAS